MLLKILVCAARCRASFPGKATSVLDSLWNVDAEMKRADHWCTSLNKADHLHEGIWLILQAL